MAVETQVPRTARETANAQDTNEANKTLRKFRKCAKALREVLCQDRPLDETEFRFIDNHFQLLQMAYFRWKRKHGAFPTG